MPRNDATHTYITLGFPRDLEAWMALQQEARERDMTVQRLIKLILVDRYHVSQGQTQEKQMVRNVVHPRTIPTRTVEAETTNDDHIVTHNAAAAATFWSDDE